MLRGFLQRKKDILSKLDKSSIGKWDEKIVKLCKKINSCENYYTTSSCSGRILVMQDQEKKAPNLFKFVSHNLISYKKFIKSLPNFYKHNTENNLHSKFLRRCFLSSPNPNANSKDLVSFKFKQEPLILHVMCKDLESAKKLLEKAQISGWKRSGIIFADKKNFQEKNSLSSPLRCNKPRSINSVENKRIVVELLSTEKLEFPLTHDGKFLVDENFLKIVLKKANENLKKGWKKIKRLERLI